VYSLGNFIFDHTYIRSTRQSVIVKINVDVDTKNINIEVIPIICEHGEYYPKIVDENSKGEIISLISTVRSKIEGRSVSDYLLSVGDYSVLVSQYRRKAKTEMKNHFIRSVHKYPLSLSTWIVKDYLRNLLKRCL